MTRLENLNSILVLRLGGIGDLITITPAARALRKAFPQARITLLAESVPAELLRPSGLFDRVLVDDDLYRCQNYFSFFTPARLRRIAAWMREVRKETYDLYLDFHDLYYFSSVFKPWLTGLVSGARVWAGLDTDGRGFFLKTKARTQTYGFEHVIDRYLKVLAALGIPGDGRQTELWLGPEDREFAQKYFETHGLSGKVFCLHPGANINFPLRFWPVEKYITVARHWLKTYEAKLLIVGGKTDQGLADQIIKALSDPRVVNAAGTVTVREFGALLEKCSFYLGADTGPLHMALACRVPSVGIFGPGNYPAYGTYGAGYEFFQPVWHPVKEFPWTRTTKVKGNPYMDAVTAEEVIAVCDRQIRKLVRCSVSS